MIAPPPIPGVVLGLDKFGPTITTREGSCIIYKVVWNEFLDSQPPELLAKTLILVQVLQVGLQQYSTSLHTQTANT